jgi:ribosomal protein L28
LDPPYIVCRTRRDWKPNVQYKYLFSEALQTQVKVCVTTLALKRIDRAGGLDMYLLTTPAASRGSIIADELRKSIVKVLHLPIPAACTGE